MDLTFAAPLWRWQGDAAWHFIALPEEIADEIEDSPLERRGFGSIRVTVQVGSSTWATSLFPDSKRGTYLLPIKKQIRDREGIQENDILEITVTPIE